MTETLKQIFKEIFRDKELSVEEALILTSILLLYDTVLSKEAPMYRDNPQWDASLPIQPTSQPIYETVASLNIAGIDTSNWRRWEVRYIQEAHDLFAEVDIAHIRNQFIETHLKHDWIISISPPSIN